MKIQPKRFFYWFSQNKWVQRFGLLFLLVALLVAAWGFLVEPNRIVFEEETVQINSLPASWEGEQIAFIADLQIGAWGANTGTIRRGVDRIIERDPAMVLIGGDLIYHAEDNLADQLITIQLLLSPLIEADIPTYVVLGNHDYGLTFPFEEPDFAQADKLIASLEATGVQVLTNEAVAQTSDSVSSDEPFYVVGLGSAWAGRSDIDQALETVPEDAARVVFMHNGRAFETIPAGLAPLALAGHTHGGQVNVPGFPDQNWLQIIWEDEIPISGWADSTYGEPGNRLYVNRGIGFSSIPFRFNTPPEITLITLQAR